MSTLREIRRALGIAGQIISAAEPLTDLGKLQKAETDSRAACQCITGLTLNQKSLENGREISRGVTAILMLRGLGRDMAHGVLAHECAPLTNACSAAALHALCTHISAAPRFMHAYLYSSRYPTLPSMVEEGICELVSAL